MNDDNMDYKEILEHRVEEVVEKLDNLLVSVIQREKYIKYLEEKIKKLEKLL